MKKAVVVLPTYNEAENISILLPRVFAQMDKISSHELHVLIVDDNSPDGTSDVARKLMHSFNNLHLITGEKKDLVKHTNVAWHMRWKSLDLTSFYR